MFGGRSGMPRGFEQLSQAEAIAGCTACATLAMVEVRLDDTVLIGGGAGGVGAFAVQLARIAGARVIGTDRYIG